MVSDSLRAEGYDVYWTGKWHAREFYPNRAERIHGFDFLPVAFEGEFRGLGLDMDSLVTDRVEQFLATPHDAPWFLGLTWHNPHDICMWIMEMFRDRFDAVIGDGELPPLPPNFEISPDEPTYFQFSREKKPGPWGAELNWTKNWSETDWRKYLRAYYRLTEIVDVELGRLMTALDRSPYGRDTLVILTSDHGEGCAAHRFVVKLTPYEEVTSVPLIIRAPGGVASGVCGTHFASGVDIVPTICDYAGASLPSSQCCGVSLRPFLENPDTLGRDFAVTNVDLDKNRPHIASRALRTQRYKYIAFSVGEPREALYDMDADPGETRNIAALPASRDALLRHRALLADWLAKTSDSFPLNCVPT